MTDEAKGEAMGRVIKIDEGRIRDHLGEMVRGTVEKALNARKRTGYAARSATSGRKAARTLGRRR